MNKVINVTFPRSGHILLMQLLSGYLKDKFKYCEFYKAAGCCHCHTIPCITPDTVFQKQHDFFRFLPPSILFIVPKNLKNWKYLISYREPIPAIISWYEMYVGDGLLDDDIKAWQYFALKAHLFYKQWVKKWVEDTEIYGKMITTYKELIEKPEATLTKILTFMDAEIDLEKVKKVVSVNNIKYRRNVKQFKYYDKKLFKILDNWI